MKIPKEYNPIMPYLIIKGAEGFVDFMKVVFNAKEQLIVPNPDGTVMHGELRVNEGVIMFSEASVEYEPFPAGMCLTIENVDEIYNRAMDNGAISLQEPANRDYGRSAGFQDLFGNRWWLMNPVSLFT